MGQPETFYRTQQYLEASVAENPVIRKKRLSDPTTLGLEGEVIAEGISSTKAFINQFEIAPKDRSTSRAVVIEGLEEVLRQAREDMDAEIDRAIING